MSDVLAAINLELVKKNAIEWYKLGKLTAQHPNKESRLCLNNGSDGYRCAVAASYPEDFKEEGGVQSLKDLGVLFFPEEDLHGISNIQQAHDIWAQPLYGIGNDAIYEVSRLQNEIAFLKTVI